MVWFHKALGIQQAAKVDPPELEVQGLLGLVVNPLESEGFKLPRCEMSDLQTQTPLWHLKP